MSGWDDFNTYRENRPSGGGFWIKLENKTDTRLRFYTEPIPVETVWAKDRTGKNMKIINPSPELVERINRERQLLGTKQELKIRTTWLLLAFNRSENSCGIYEAPFQVMGHLAKFRDMEEYGSNLAKYDVSIDKDVDRNPVYTAQALPPKALTEEEKTMMKEFGGKVNFDDLTKDTPESEVVEALGLDAVESSGGSKSTSDDDDFMSSLDDKTSKSTSNEDNFLEL